MKLKDTVGKEGPTDIREWREYLQRIRKQEEWLQTSEPQHWELNDR